MLRMTRRLCLEPYEDRWLPASLAPTSDSPTPTVATAHTAAAEPLAKAANSGSDSTVDNAAEYATNGKSAAPADKSPDPATEYTTPKLSDINSAEYALVIYPAAPPMPTGPTTPPPLTFVPPATPNAVSVSAAVQAATEFIAAPPVQAPPSAPPVPAGSGAVPLDGELSEPHPGPRGGTEDQPAIPDTELPPSDPSTPSFAFLDDLTLRVDLAGWANTASQLLDGLDAIGSPLDGESPWMRLGYWVLAVGTVGVTVELTRQGLRAKLPEPEDVAVFPVNR